MNRVNSFVVLGGGRRFPMRIPLRRREPERLARQLLVGQSPSGNRVKDLREAPTITIRVGWNGVAW